jgi:Tfp pilus assembly protein PilX
MQTYKSVKRQQGATLIVTLMILVAMTTLGLSSIRSTSIQQTIVKNTQFLMSARNVAKTEINAQLDIININAATEPDTIIQTMIDAGENNPRNTSLAKQQSTYGQTVSMTLNCKACPAPTGGFSYGLGVQALMATITSTAEMTSTAANSTQEQGFWYLVPAGS